MKTKRIVPLVLALTLSFGNVLLLQAPVAAASLSTSYLRLNRMTAGSQTSARLVFKTSAAGATSVTVNMNGADATTWTAASGAVAATQTASSASCVADVAGATALPGTLSTSAGNAGTGVITISPVTSLAASTLYCVDLTSATALTVPTAGEYHPVITAGSDSITLAVRSVTNDSVVVTATVPPSFNFVLSGNTDNFTTGLAAGSVGTTSGVNATVNTNAKNGWLAWAKDTSSGLNSAAAATTIPSTTPGSSATLTAGTPGYTMGITTIAQGSGTGVTAPIAAYDATGGSTHGSGLDTTYRQIATSNGSASSAVLTLKERAAISALTPAGNDYTDTITIIGAGNF